MWPYWLMLLLPGFGAATRKRLPPEQARWAWLAVGAFLVVMIGLRHEVGGDWYAYDRHFHSTGSLPFGEVFSWGRDVGYYSLSWVVFRLGGSVHCLNFLCAIPLVWGVVALARKQPWPWLGLFAAVPYLLIVVGMGYTRQSAAIGFVMVGLVALSNGKTRSFVVWTVIAATFHKTATLMIPLAALAANRNRVWTTAWVLVMTALCAWLFLSARSERLWANYVESAYADASSGGAIRVAMNAVPAILFLLFRNRLAPDRGERKLWTWVSVLALLCVPMLWISATATDRIALYFIPLQVIVAARLCQLARNVTARTGILIAVLSFYVAVQFVWLNFAEHAHAWVPYQFIPVWN